MLIQMDNEAAPSDQCPNLAEKKCDKTSCENGRVLTSWIRQTLAVHIYLEVQTKLCPRDSACSKKVHKRGTLVFSSDRETYLELCFCFSIHRMSDGDLRMDPGQRSWETRGRHVPRVVSALGLVTELQHEIGLPSFWF